MYACWFEFNGIAKILTLESYIFFIKKNILIFWEFWQNLTEYSNEWVKLKNKKEICIHQIRVFKVSEINYKKGHNLKELNEISNNIWSRFLQYPFKSER
jgi:hypothetical protein